MRVWELTREVNSVLTNHDRLEPLRSVEIADFLRRTGHPVKSPSLCVVFLPLEHEAYVEAIRKHYLQLPF